MAVRKTKTTKTASTASPKKSTVSTETMSFATPSTRLTKIADGSGVRVKKSQVLVLIAVVLLLLLAYIFRSLFVAALVNNEPITRLEIVKQLERLGGNQVLNSLVAQKLIMQEAKKKGLVASDKEVDAQIKIEEEQYKKQGQSFSDALKAQHMTLPEYREQIRFEKTVPKLLGKIEISDKEIDDYLKQNAGLFPAGTDPKQQREQVKQTLIQDKSRAKVQELIGKLRQDGKVLFFVSY